MKNAFILLLFLPVLAFGQGTKPGFKPPISPSEISTDSSRASATGKYRLFLKSGSLYAKPRTGNSFALGGGGGGGGGPAIWNDIIDRPDLFPPLFTGPLQDSLNTKVKLSVYTAGLAGKQNAFTTGSSSQYLKGDLSLGTFNSDVRGLFGATGNALAFNSSTGEFSLGFDATPTASSTNLVRSGALFTALAGKQNAITPGTSSQYVKGDLSFGTFQTDVRNQLSAGTGLGYSSGQFSVTTPVASPTGQSGRVLLNNGIGTLWADLPTGLPSQTGKAGQYVTTNGSTPSWTALGTVVNSNLSTSDADSNSTIPDMARVKRLLNSYLATYWPYDSTQFQIVDGAATTTDLITKQGNSFNGTDQLTKTDGSGKLPSAVLNLASQAEAEAGTNNTNPVTPLRTKQSILAELVNNLTTTTANKLLDARQGKALKDLIDALTTTVAGKQNALPSQTGNASKVLGTDGTNLAWVEQTGGGGGGGAAVTNVAITSGTSSTLSNAAGEIVVVVNPSATLDSYALTLPASPVANQVVSIYFGGSITTGPVVNAFSLPATVIQANQPGSVSAGEKISVRYNSTTSKWYRND